MKVVEVIPDLSKRAGAEVFFESLCFALSKISNLHLVVIVIWDSIDESFSKLKVDSKIKFYCCGKTKRGVGVRSVRTFRKIIIKENPDVIHTHRSVLLTYFLSFGLKKYSWTLFHTVHNIASKEAGKYEIILRKIFVRKRIINHIGISDKISDSIYALYKERPICTIYNGITISRKPPTLKKYDLICVARFSTQKNHIMLLRLFERILKIRPKTSLLLVGDGELRSKCEKFVYDNGINNVTFFGATENALELMNSSKIFILSSLYEGNPISILEALSLGLPIIAPDVGGISDIVENGINGYLFEKNNIIDAYNCVISLIDNMTLIDEMYKRNTAKSFNYSIEACAKKYYELFSKK